MEIWSERKRLMSLNLSGTFQGKLSAVAVQQLDN